MTITRARTRIAVLMVAFAFSSRVVFAGDAVAIAYNREDVWTTVTYYCSSTPPGGKDYQNEKQASETAVRDLHRRSKYPVAKTSVLSSSDATGFATVARGPDKSGRDETVIGRGKTQPAADDAAEKLLQAAGVAKHKIVYRYFSYGADAK